MTLSIISEPVPLNTYPDGAVRVANTRVTLDSVIQAFNEGATAEQIVQAYPVLVLADVYAVLGYYLRWTADVDAYLHAREMEANQVRAETLGRTNLQGIRSRLEARRTKSGG